MKSSLISKSYLKRGLAVVVAVSTALFAIPNLYASPNMAAAFAMVARVVQNLTQGNSPAEKLLASGQCSLNEVCTNHGKEKLWAQTRVDADLAQVEVDRILLETHSTRVKVAVVDSGFDLNNLASQMEGSVRVSKVTDETDSYSGKRVGNPNIDENGHGSWVSGVIMGKDGVGITKVADLVVYRATIEGDTGSTAGSWLSKGLKRACDENQDSDGITIINMSWGGSFDESGFSTDEKSNQSLITYLGEHGCLVTKSAGNSNFRNKNRSNYNLDDAYLRVAATDFSDYLTWFSSNGEISAPGYGVYSTESQTQKLPTKDTNKRCGGDTNMNLHRFVSGTSFSAPLVAGIAANVSAVLKAKGAFAQFRPADRIKLVNRILKASMFPTSTGQNLGSVNALRAVMLAEQFGNANLSVKEVPTVDQLLGLIQVVQQNTCKQAPDCLSKSDCGQLQSCAKELRKYRAMCGGTDLATSNENLLRLDISAKNLESAVHQTSLMGSASSGQLNKPTLVALKKYLLDLYEARWKKLGFGFTDDDKIKDELDVNVARELIADILTYNQDPNLTTDQILHHVKLMLESDSMDDYLSRGPERGGEEYLENTLLFLSIVDQKFGTASAEKLLQEWVDRHLSRKYAFDSTKLKSYSKHYISEDGTAFVAPIRTINEIYVRPELNKLVPTAQALENKMLERIRQRNDLYGAEVDIIGSMFGVEVQTTQDFLFKLIDRHQQEILKNLAEHGVAALAPIEVKYLLTRSLDQVAPEVKLNLAEQVLNAISENRGWSSDNDNEIYGLTLKQFSSLYANSPESRPRVDQLINKLIQETKNFYLAKDLFKVFEREASEASGAIRKPGEPRVRRPTFATEANVGELALRIIQTLTLTSGEAKTKQFYRLDSVFFSRLVQAIRWYKETSPVPGQFLPVSLETAKRTKELDRFTNPGGFVEAVSLQSRKPRDLAYQDFFLWIQSAYEEGTFSSVDLYLVKTGSKKEEDLKLSFGEPRAVFVNATNGTSLTLGVPMLKGNEVIKSKVAELIANIILENSQAIADRLSVQQETTPEGRSHEGKRRYFNYLVKSSLGEGVDILSWAQSHAAQNHRGYEPLDFVYLEQYMMFYRTLNQ